MIVNKQMFPAQSGYSVISQMQDKFSTLQMQLGTGQKASTLSEMSKDLPVSLSVRARLNTIAGYSSNIDTVNLRLTFLNNAMTRFDKMEAEARTASMPGQYGTGGINMATMPNLAAARFDEIVTILNQDVAGRYIFGGKVTDKPPLANTTALLEGQGGKAGYKAIAGDRAIADGVGGLGRLETDASTAGKVVLREDGATPFGFKVSTVSSSGGPSITVDQPTGGAIDQVAVNFNGAVIPGQTVTIGLTLPDGTETQLKLTATADNPPGAGQFTIGANENATALNFRTSLEKGLTELSYSELKAASGFAAATDFFSESGIPQVPVGGPPPTGLADADPAKVVFWYKGGTDADPRGSVTAAVEDGSPVRYGIQANESGFLALLRSQAALANANFPSEDNVRAEAGNVAARQAAMAQPEGAARDSALAAYEAKIQTEYRRSLGYFDGMASRQQSALSEGHNTEKGSIEIITMELGIVAGRVQSATTRHTDYKGQLENLLSDVETISKEDVAMQMMDLQTRLQASYQTTSMLSKLNLVNYL
ncbi:hypothetical protein [Devosia sp. 2618]|uniref:flagellin n=1 Tax=Devosia sp. 2618 TaxID=3156454 RepID=UPI00339227C1